MKEFYKPRIFTQLVCPREQAVRPHWAGQVLAQHGERVELELHCQKCGNKVVQELAELPEGYSVYQVRVTGEDNPQLPAAVRPLPFLEEELAVMARSVQEAHEVAEFAHNLRFGGHVVKYYINGERHLDERF